MKADLTEDSNRRIADIVHDNVRFWAEVLAWAILVRLDQMETRIMTTLDEAKADADALVALVQTLIDAFNAAKNGTLTAEQQAAVDAIDADIHSISDAVNAAENPPPPTP